MLIWCLQDNPPYNVSGKNGFVLHLLIIFKNGFQLPRNANYPKNNYFVTSLKKHNTFSYDAPTMNAGRYCTRLLTGTRTYVLPFNTIHTSKEKGESSPLRGQRNPERWRAKPLVYDQDIESVDSCWVMINCLRSNIGGNIVLQLEYRGQDTAMHWEQPNAITTGKIYEIVRLYF